MALSVYHDSIVTSTFRDAAIRKGVTVAGRQIPRPFPSPTDWRNQWIYFLMVDRFNNPSAPPATSWDVATSNRQGGTLEGVRQKLTYIRDLGAGAIWLTPVLKNRQSDASHHGYAIEDFLQVDPRLGTDADMVRLVEEAHALGMYVIMDIVINHSADLFAYDMGGGQLWDAAPWSHSPMDVAWRDPSGRALITWRDAAFPVANMTLELSPVELQRNDYFRRQGKGGPIQGDFETLKEFKTEFRDQYGDMPVWNILIRSYQHAIAKYDVDAFRLDTLKHVERPFALSFCNAIREFACSIGKENFFIFGETKDGNKVIADYTGRNTSDEQGRVGADAQLDFPLFWSLPAVIKGFSPPTAVAQMFDERKKALENVLSSHGEASRFFVTFPDNHDESRRFNSCLDPRYDPQVTMMLATLFSLQGIPCVYYGTEVGLKGTREIYAGGSDNKPELVREAMWGAPTAFDESHPFYKELSRISKVRSLLPALRFGRQYFREVSGNNTDFGLSNMNGGILALSRVLNDQEVVIVANTSTTQSFTGWVIIDGRINNEQTSFQVRYTNQPQPGQPGSGIKPVGGGVTFWNWKDGQASQSWALRVPVTLRPMEAQILAP